MKEPSPLRQRSSIEELHHQSQIFTKQLPFQYFSDSLSEFVTILNENRQVVFCNQAMLRYLHAADVNDVIGKRPGEALQCAHAVNDTGGCGTTEFCTMCGANRAFIQSRQGTAAEQECRITTSPEARALDLSVRSTPFNYSNDTFTIFALTDIADEKRRKVLESIFFHDIMNTVGGLMGYSQLLEQATTDEVQEFVPIIGKLATDIYDQIMVQQELLRAEHHEITVVPAMIHSRSLLESVSLAVQRHAVAENKHIVADSASDDFMFISDERIVRRVLMNLVKNALEASAAGESVQVSCRKSDSGVRLDVRNAGVIPRSIQLQIFQRSFSTKGEGRGLGTYSVKLFTEQYLGGTVSFASNPDDGTVFSVLIPAALTASEAVEKDH
jgi:signal transduction histidine kinase